MKTELDVELPGERSSLPSQVLVPAALLGDPRPAEDCLAVLSAVLGTSQMSGSGNISFSPFRTRFNLQFIQIKNCFTAVFFFLLNKIQVAVKLSLIHVHFLVPKSLNFCFKTENRPQS